MGARARAGPSAARLAFGPFRFGAFFFAEPFAPLEFFDAAFVAGFAAAFFFFAMVHLGYDFTARLI